MRLGRMFALALAVAAVATTMAGVGNASASEICKEIKSPCPEAVLYKAGDKINGELQSEQWVLKGALGVEVHCQKSVFSSEITENPGKVEGGAQSQAKGSINAFTLTECAVGSESQGTCVLEFVQLPYMVHFNKVEIPLGDGSVYIGPGSSGLQPGYKFVSGCGVFNGCTYKVNETQPGHVGSLWAQGAFTHTGTVAHLTFNQLAIKSSFFCGGNSGRIEASYTVTSAQGKPIYLV